MSLLRNDRGLSIHHSAFNYMFRRRERTGVADRWKIWHSYVKLMCLSQAAIRVPVCR